MRILYLANNKLGWQIGKWLVEETDDEIVGLVVHPQDKRRYGDEILDLFNFLPDSQIFDGSTLRNQATRDAIANLNADICLSIFFGYILKPAFIDLFPKGVMNLHPSYLPYNRGASPNIWSIIENTPAGVTLHYIDSGIDTGKIIVQREVQVDPTDTAKTLYEKLEHASYQLFVDSWDSIKSESFEPVLQSPDEGTFHYVKDIQSIDEIDLDATYVARDLINILRARTFPPYKGAYFLTEDGRRVNIRIELEYLESLSQKE
ncbi:formyltransferase family protein [Anaerolineales bacterium]